MRPFGPRESPRVLKGACPTRIRPLPSRRPNRFDAVGAAVSPALTAFERIGTAAVRRSVNSGGTVGKV